MNEVHGPGLVRSGGHPTVVPQLRLHPALGHLVAKLQPQLLVKTIDPLWIDRPSVSAQQDVDPAISVPYSRLADLLDALLQLGLRATLRLLDVKSPIDPEGGAGTPGRHLPIAANRVDKLPLARRPQS